MNINLVKATSDQAIEINDLVNLAYRGDIGWTKETDLVSGNRSSIEEVEGYLMDPNAHLLVAIDRNKIISCVCIEEKEGNAFIGYFAVHPSYQGKGFGNIILSKAEHFASNNLKIEKYVLVVVTQRTELISYYERRGYKKTGKVLDYPMHLNVGIPKDSFLTIEYLEKNA